jgi:hypothetical protein
MQVPSMGSSLIATLPPSDIPSPFSCQYVWQKQEDGKFRVGNIVDQVVPVEGAWTSAFIYYSFLLILLKLNNEMMTYNLMI